MRSPLLLSALLITTIVSAQVDINKMIQERMGGDAKIEDDTSPYVPNAFIGSFRMEMHMYKSGVEGEHSPMIMRYYSKEDMILNKMEMPSVEDGKTKGRDMSTLTDLKCKWTYTLMTDEDGKKMAMKSKKKKLTISEEPKDAGKVPEITVTNETKSIEGHTCTKVIVKSEDGTWTGWVAKEIKAPFEDMTRNMAQHGNEQGVKNYEGVEGFPLEYEWVDAKSGDKMICYMKELKLGAVDASVFSLDGYEVMEMPSFRH